MIIHYSKNQSTSMYIEMHYYHDWIKIRVLSNVNYVGLYPLIYSHLKTQYI